MDQSYKIFCSQVSGKAPKLLSHDQSSLLKDHSPNQQSFYQYMASLNTNSLAYALNHFIPKYHRVINMEQVPTIQHNQNVQDQKTLEWLKHLKQRYTIRNPQNKFLILENLIFSYAKPNALDIKLGKKGQKILKPKKKDFKDFFILNGCRMYINSSFPEFSDKNHEILFLSKYFLQTLKTNQQIISHLALYFSDGHTIKTELLGKIINKLRQLILSLKAFKGWKFYSSSLCIFYDAENPKNFDLRLIDFGRSLYTGLDQIEEASIIGLENVHRLLMQVKENTLQLEEKLHQMKFKYLNEEILMIPQNKLLKYDCCSSRQVSDTFSPKKSIAQIQKEFMIQN